MKQEQCKEEILTAIEKIETLLEDSIDRARNRGTSPQDIDQVQHFFEMARHLSSACEAAQKACLQFNMTPLHDVNKTVAVHYLGVMEVSLAHAKIAADLASRED